MPYKQWDIILVPFPFTDLSAFKRRPALVVSPNEYNQGVDMVIAFITSKMDVMTSPGDCPIRDWEKANLPKPSLIRRKFATIDQTIVVKKLGRLADRDIACFREMLSYFFLS